MIGIYTLMSSIKAIDDYLYKSTTANRISEFKKLLEEYHKKKNQKYGISHFVQMLDYMFSIFVSKITEYDSNLGKEVEPFSLYGYFDTGDAHSKPFPPFCHSLDIS